MMKSLLLFLTLPLLGAIGLAAEKSAPKRVAFIFDDGPTPEQNARLLRVLKDAGARVTFAHVGRAVEAHPELARAAHEAGHEINNHSYSHPHLRELDEAAVRHELVRTAEAVQRATGVKPAWFWAPFLETNDTIDAIAREATGVEHFPFKKFHFISTEDWNQATSADEIERAATTDVRDGTIVLCHEWRAETVDRLPAILAELKRQGCTFVTFSELLAK